MPRWRVTGVVTGSKYLGEVEADDEASAKEKGLELDGCTISLCHQCSSECEDGQVEDVIVSEVIE